MDSAPLSWVDGCEKETTMQELHKPSPGLTSKQRRENATNTMQMIRELQLTRVLYELISQVTGCPLKDLRIRPGGMITSADQDIEFKRLICEKFSLSALPMAPEDTTWRGLCDAIIAACPNWVAVVDNANWHELPDHPKEIK